MLCQVPRTHRPGEPLGADVGTMWAPLGLQPGGGRGGGVIWARVKEEGSVWGRSPVCRKEGFH